MIAMLEARRAGLFSRAHWLRNILAGLIVGVVVYEIAGPMFFGAVEKFERALLETHTLPRNLILHGTSDSPSDGGSAYTTVQMARSFVLALRKAGKRVQVHYYEGSGHNGIFASRTQFDDEAHRGAAYLRQLSTD